MQIEGGKAVLLTQGGEFREIKNKGYSVGDKVQIRRSYAARIGTVAAALAVFVIGGGASYFMPASYVSMDINPSFLMTLNVYDKVINIEPLNDDAEAILSVADIEGRNVNDTVSELVEKSERAGYINASNNEVVMTVVPGIRTPKINGNNKPDNISFKISSADKKELAEAKEIGVSIDKARAIEEYTDTFGGNVRTNADKLEGMTVKQIHSEIEKKSPQPSPSSERTEHKSDNKTGGNAPIQKQPEAKPAAKSETNTNDNVKQSNDRNPQDSVKAQRSSNPSTVTVPGSRREPSVAESVRTEPYRNTIADTDIPAPSDTTPKLFEDIPTAEKSQPVRTEAAPANEKVENHSFSADIKPSDKRGSDMDVKPSDKAPVPDKTDKTDDAGIPSGTEAKTEPPKTNTDNTKPANTSTDNREPSVTEKNNSVQGSGGSHRQADTQSDTVSEKTEAEPAVREEAPASEERNTNKENAAEPVEKNNSRTENSPKESEPQGGERETGGTGKDNAPAQNDNPAERDTAPAQNGNMGGGQHGPAGDVR